jgi:hypothetical protein
MLAVKARGGKLMHRSERLYIKGAASKKPPDSKIIEENHKVRLVWPRQIVPALGRGSILLTNTRSILATLPDRMSRVAKKSPECWRHCGAK